MTTQELIDEFRLIADDGRGTRLWADAELCVYAAEAEREAARRSRLIRDDTTSSVAVYAVTAGTRSITLDPRVIFVRDARRASFELPLERIRKRRMDYAFPNWDSTLNLGEVLYFVPDKESGKLWFSAPFPVDDTVTLTVIREPMAALTNGAPVNAYADIDVGGMGPLRVTAAIAGSVPNGASLTWGGTTGGGSTNRAMSVAFDGTNVAITLGTDNAGAYDATKNTFPLIAVAVNALGFFTAADMGDGTDVVTAADSTTFANGGSTTVVNPEILGRYHHGLVQWMLWRAFGKQDAETNDPKRSQAALEEFESEFGKRSRAIDETYISEHDQFDGLDGTF